MAPQSPCKALSSGRGSCWHRAALFIAVLLAVAYGVNELSRWVPGMLAHVAAVQQRTRSHSQPIILYSSGMPPCMAMPRAQNSCAMPAVRSEALRAGPHA